MSNLVQTNVNSNLISGIIWMGYTPIRPSKLEIIIANKIENQFTEYDYITSLFSNNRSMDIIYDDAITMFKSVQLPKFIVYIFPDIVGYSSETGSTLTKFTVSYPIKSLIEFANNRFGYIMGYTLFIHDLDTMDFIENYQTNSGLRFFYQTFPLSPDRNIFLADESNNLLIIQFDTKTELWKGKIQTYMAHVTAAIQIKENNFLYSDSTGKIWIIDLNNDLHPLFLDLAQYEKDNFNYYPVVKPKIKTMSIVRRSNYV